MSDLDKKVLLEFPSSKRPKFSQTVFQNKHDLKLKYTFPLYTRAGTHEKERDLCVTYINTKTHAKTNVHTKQTLTQKQKHTKTHIHKYPHKSKNTHNTNARKQHTNIYVHKITNKNNHTSKYTQKQAHTHTITARGEKGCK